MKIIFVKNNSTLSGCLIDDLGENWVESDVAPEVGDKVKIGKSFYKVANRIFEIIEKGIYLNVYLDEIM